MIGNVPNGWRVEKLKDITEFLTCGVAKRPEYVEKEIGIPFLSSKNAKTNRMILDDYNCVSKEDYEILTKYYKPQRGDILYTRVGSFGEAVVVNVDFDFAVFVSLTIMRVKSNIVNNHYISNILNSPLIKQLANEKARGIGVKNLNVSDVRNFNIPIPPLPQQEKIVKVLDISSLLIEKQKELIADYDLFLKSKFIEMFGDPIKNPMGWEVEKLDNFTTLVSSGSTPKGGQSSYLDEGEIRFIRSQNVRMNEMDYDGIYYISDEVYTKMKRSQVKFNDVLLNITGASIGRTAIYKDTTRANVNQHVCIIRLTEELNNEYLSFMISIDSFQNQIISNQSGATREALNYSQIKKFNIQYPPIELQNKFAQIVEKIETIKNQETQKLEHLETLHKSLMDKAFKGEVI
ncbi:MAG: restriction endonuclease subunit S [Campylobacterota bacterium]|nr:restriction endonuclease subunit S [Campylobacterota bacterium]